MSSQKPDLSQYNKIKDYKGKKYSGVKVGHGHKWQYEACEWNPNRPQEQEKLKKEKV
jgi:hypothetical protein